MTTVVYDKKHRVLYTDCRTTHRNHTSDATNKVVNLTVQNHEDRKLGRLICMTGSGNVGSLTASYRDILEYGPTEYANICDRYESVRRVDTSTVLVIGENGHLWFGMPKKIGAQFDGTGSGMGAGLHYLRLAAKNVITIDEAMLLIGASDKGSSTNYLSHAITDDNGLIEVHHDVTNVVKTQRALKKVMAKITEHLNSQITVTAHKVIDRSAFLLSAVPKT